MSRAFIVRSMDMNTHSPPLVFLQRHSSYWVWHNSKIPFWLLCLLTYTGHLKCFIRPNLPEHTRSSVLSTKVSTLLLFISPKGTLAGHHRNFLTMSSHGLFGNYSQFGKRAALYATTELHRFIRKVWYNGKIEFEKSAATNCSSLVMLKLALIENFDLEENFAATNSSIKSVVYCILKQVKP